MKRSWLALVTAVAGLVLPASSAFADSASIDAFQDAGGGQVRVTYTVTSDATDGFGYGGWFAYLAEDHTSRSCNPSWANYLRHVGTLLENPGTVTSTVTFRPFFPRRIKLCVYLNNPAGQRAVLDRTFSIPSGYGFQRSSGYNCSAFGRYSAQDYFWLYPGDPSGLDADNDGAACEDNSGPGPGPPIPAEPAPPPPPPPPVTACSDGLDNDGDGAIDLAEEDYCFLPSDTTEGPPPRKPQCSDGQDNDGDGKVDYPSDRQCKRAADKREAPDALPKLSLSATRRYIARALRQEFKGAYRYGQYKRIGSCARRSRARVICRSVSWGAGDLGYRGRVTVWYANEANGEVWWNYSLTIKRTDYYCLARKRDGARSHRKKRCTKVYRVT